MPTAVFARLRHRARQCRRAAFGMPRSPARAAVERLALRWDIIAEAEYRRSPPAANDA